MPIALALVGFGKIARDAHWPALQASSEFLLACVVDPVRPAGIDLPWFPDLKTALAATHDLQAVSIATPPQVRADLARNARAAGLHVLLEKPPAGTLAEAEALAELAGTPGPVLFAAWHSRFAPMLEPARAWLDGRRITGGRMLWREDWREWHPGQRWLWQAGGLGAFDPGINGLSLLTALDAGPWTVAQARFEVPANAATPARVSMVLQRGEVAIEVEIDCLAKGDACWRLDLHTDAGELSLDGGGSALAINGGPWQGATGAGGPCNPEYAALYTRFAQLIRENRSELDLTPLQLVTEAQARAECVPIGPLDFTPPQQQGYRK